MGALELRIHFDRIDGLGTFLEFEAVLGPETDDAVGRKQLQELIKAFAILPADMLSGSYADMLD